jgi:ribonuclease BN (tRNA processing enzyme)
MCKKKFEPIHRTSKVCSCTCAGLYYDQWVKVKGKKASREVAKMVGMRSMGEVRFTAENMEATNIPYEYEPDTFEYRVEETKHYTPDYKYKKRGRGPTKYFYVEYKGVLKLEDRKKAERMRAQHPDVEIYFVFQRHLNKICKGSKTTYGMWCDKNGFGWSDKLEDKWFQR